MSGKKKRRDRTGNSRKSNIRVLNVLISALTVFFILSYSVCYFLLIFKVEQQYIVACNEVSINVSKNIINSMQQYSKNNVVLDDKNIEELLYSLAATENDVLYALIVSCNVDGELNIVGKDGTIVDEDTEKKINSNRDRLLEQQSFIDRTNSQYSVYRYLFKLDGVDYYYCLCVNTISQFSNCCTIMLFYLCMVLMLYRVFPDPLEKLLFEMQDLAKRIDKNLKSLSDFPSGKSKCDSGFQEIDTIVSTVNSAIDQLEISMSNEKHLQEMVVKNKNEIDGMKNSMAFTKKINNFQSLALKYLRDYDDTKSMLANLAKIFSLFLDCDIIAIFVQNNDDLETCIFNTEYEKAENEIIDNILNSDFNKDKKWDIQVQIEYNEMPAEIQCYIGERIDEEFINGSICSGRLAGKIYSIVFLNRDKRVCYGEDRANITRLLQICQTTSENLLLRHQLVYDSEHDKMTHLYNRDRYIKMVKQWDTSTRAVGVMYLDVNNLKEVNDNLGHEHGDRLIKKAAASARSILDDKTMGFRVGGDEFVIILKDCTEKKLSQKVQTLKNAIAEANKKEEIPWCDVAIGVCLQKDCVESIEKLVNDADANMYANKRVAKQMNESVE